MARVQTSLPVKPPVVSRPRFLDYFLILAGLALSLLLGEINRHPSGEATTPLAKVLPLWLHLSLGIVLLWPLFYMTQKILGRHQELTWAEWLWGLAWLGAVVFAAWILWKGLGSLPEFMAGKDFQKNAMLAYFVFIISMGGLASLLFIGGLFRRGSVPWTHSFGLALLMWPLVPLAIGLMLGHKLE